MSIVLYHKTNVNGFSAANYVKEYRAMITVRKIVIISLVTALLASPLSAFALHDEINKNRTPADPAGILIDLVLARPLGLVVTAAGSVIFVAALPFSLLAGNTEETFESLVISPVEYTFKRPMGNFEQ